MSEKVNNQWIFSQLDTLLQDAISDVNASREEFHRRTTNSKDGLVSGRKTFSGIAATGIAIVLAIAAAGHPEAYAYLVYPVAFGIFFYFFWSGLEFHRERKYDTLFSAFETSQSRLLLAKKEILRMSFSSEQIPSNLSQKLPDYVDVVIANALIPLWESLRDHAKSLSESDFLSKYCKMHEKELRTLIEEGRNRRVELSGMDSNLWSANLLRLSAELEEAHISIHTRKVSTWWG